MTETIKQKTISSLVWKLLERGGSSVIQLVIQIVLARILAPQQFGALAIMLVFVNVGNVIVQSGLGTALVRSPEASDEDFSTVFWMCLLVSTLLYIVVFISAPFVSEFYQMPELVLPLRVLALLLIINAFSSLQVAKVSRSLDFRKVFFASLTSVVVSGLFGIGTALLNWGLWALVVQQLSFQLVNCCVLAFQIKWHPSFVFNWKRAKELYSFGWKLLVSGLLEVGYQSLSDLIIGKQFSAVQLAFVTQGKRYPQAIGTTLDGAIQPVMLSAVARVQDDLGYVKRLVRRALKTSTYLIVPCMVLFALVAEPLVRLLLGEQWLPCVFYLQVFCLTFALLPIHTSNLQALNAMGRSDLFLRLEIIKKIYGLAFLLIAAFVFNSVELMVISYLLTGIISTFVNAYPNKNVINYSYIEQMRDILPALLASFISAAIAWWLSLLHMPDIFTILSQAIVMVVVYLSLSKLFHIEAFEYLLHNARGYISGRREKNEGSG